MRIAFVTPYGHSELRFGGPPKKVWSLATGLSVRGHSVCLITFDHQHPSSTYEKRIDGVEVHCIRWCGSGLRQWPVDRVGLRDEIAKSELVHCYGIYNLISPVAAGIAKRQGKALVIEPLGMYPPRAVNQLAKKIYNAAITRRMFKRSNAVIAASEAEAADLRTFVPSANIVYRRNGIDVLGFASLPRSDKLRQDWKLRTDERVVLFAGRLSPIKNLEQLVSAFDRANLSNARLILVGPGEPAYERSLRNLIFREQLGEKVVLAGPLYGDDQKAALSAADLFVLPSLNESFGNAAGEAVAAGIPVLLTETCGIARMIDQRAGLAVKLGTESIAEGLRRMMDDQELRERVTARREQVKQELSWDEPIQQTEEIYRAALRDQERAR